MRNIHFHTSHLCEKYPGVKKPNGVPSKTRHINDVTQRNPNLESQGLKYIECKSNKKGWSKTGKERAWRQDNRCQREGIGGKESTEELIVLEMITPSY